MLKTLFLVGMIIFSFPVCAETSDDGFYTRTDIAGVYAAQRSLKEGNGLQMGFGQRWNDFLRGEFTLEYTRISMKGSDIYNGVGKQGRSRLVSYAAMLAGYVDLASDRMVSPYIGAGMGVSRNDSFDVVVDGRQFFGKSKFRFAWKVVGGIGFKLPKNLMLDVGYSYTDLGDFSAEEFLAPSVKQDAETRKISIGLRYLF